MNSIYLVESYNETLKQWSAIGCQCYFKDRINTERDCVNWQEDFPAKKFRVREYMRKETE
jgi:hypothetical protein